MVATCGYDTRGVARLAAPDHECRVFSERKLWGFCPSSVSYAHDCGLAGYCIDDYDCANGCGPFPGDDDMTTFTCKNKSHCSTVISDNFGHTYDYIACGAEAPVETIFARPPPVSATTTSSTPSSAPSSMPSSTKSSTTASTSSSSIVDSSSITSTSMLSSASTSTASTSTPSPLPLNSGTDGPAAAAESGNSTPLGPIIGGVVGGVAMVCLTVLAIFYIRHRRSNSSPSNTPLRRSSSCIKHPEREDHFEIHELGDQRRRLFEASELNNEPAELPGYDSRKQRSAV